MVAWTTATVLFVGTVGCVGMFDTVHTGRRCGQVKAFARTLAEICPGDRVDYGANLPDDIQVAMPSGGFIIVRDRTFVGWEPIADPVALTLDRFGNVATVDDLLHATFGPDRDEVDTEIARLVTASARADSHLVASPDTIARRERAHRYGTPRHCDWCETLVPTGQGAIRRMPTTTSTGKNGHA